MKKTHQLVTTLMVILIFPLSATASDRIYRYVDQTGQVSFTDDISQVPIDQRIKSKSFKSVPTPETPAHSDPKEDTLYYDQATDIRIINREGFLLKITRNSKGLKVVSELGPFPDAYPENLPAPGTHINMPLD